MQPALTEVVNVEVKVPIWICDNCGTKARHSFTECIGCGKHFCLNCKSKYETLEYEVGHGSIGEGYNSIPESDDHRGAFIYLCNDCKEHPPEKLHLLLTHINMLNEVQQEEYSITNVIIDEIEKLNQKL